MFVDKIITHHFDGFVQDCNNSSALAMELLQSCTKLSIWNELRLKNKRDLFLPWYKNVWYILKIQASVSMNRMLYRIFPGKYCLVFVHAFQVPASNDVTETPEAQSTDLTGAFVGKRRNASLELGWWLSFGKDEWKRALGVSTHDPVHEAHIIGFGDNTDLLWWKWFKQLVLPIDH